MEVGEILNDYVVYIAQALGILQENKNNPVKCPIESPCEGIIKHFQSHLSILKTMASLPVMKVMDIMNFGEKHLVNNSYPVNTI